MKKMLSVLLAVLLAALPVLGLAEEAGLPGLAGLAAGQTFTQKYTAEGQRSVTDIHMELSENFYQMTQMPDEIADPVKDLLKALTIEVSSQAAEGNAQFTLRLLTAKDGAEPAEAADFTVALAKDGLYASSSFLGDRTVHVTTEQLEQLLEQLKESILQQMVAQGSLTQEQVDQLKKAQESFSANPEEALASLIGNPDFGPVMLAAFNLFEAGEAQEVTEQPEGVPFTAKTAATLTLKKDAMKNLTTELAKALWSMPIVQQLAGKEATEESLAGKLNAIPEALTEDVVITIYAGEEGKQLMAFAEPKFTTENGILPVKISVLADTSDGLKASVTAEAEKDGSGMKFTYNFAVKPDGSNGTAQVEADVDLTENGETFRMMEEVYDIAWTGTDTVRTIKMDISVRVRQDPTSEPVGIRYSIQGEERDLGDHAEEDATVVLSMDGIGDLMTVTVNSKTDLAEAYIITEDAARPLDSEEAMNEFTSSLTGSLPGGLLKLINALPESVQKVVIQMMNNGAQ